MLSKRNPLFNYLLSFAGAGCFREFCVSHREAVFQRSLPSQDQFVAERDFEDRAGSVRELREHDGPGPESQQAGEYFQVLVRQLDLCY